MADPTFQQLRVFLVVAEEGSIGRAAARLQMAQPPVTRHVRALERALGIELFIRDHRGVRLTREGRIMLGEAQRLIHRWDQSLDDLHERRHIRLGAVESIALGSLPQVLAQLRREFPNVVWSLREGHTDDLVAALGAYECDAVVVRGPLADARHRVADLGEEELLLALPVNHRLAGSTPCLADLAGEDFVVYSRHMHGISTTVMDACRASGFTPRVRAEALGTELLLALVAAGDGVGFVSPTAAAERPGVTFSRLDGDQVTSPIVMTWHSRAPHKAILALGRHLRAAREPSNV